MNQFQVGLNMGIIVILIVSFFIEITWFFLIPYFIFYNIFQFIFNNINKQEVKKKDEK